MSNDPDDIKRKALEQAWSDLRAYDFASLEGLIDAIRSEREKLAERQRRLAQNNPYIGRSTDEVPLQYQSTDEYAELRERYHRIDRKFLVLKNREMVALEIRRRRIYGEEVPRLQDAQLFDDRTIEFAKAAREYIQDPDCGGVTYVYKRVCNDLGVSVGHVHDWLATENPAYNAPDGATSDERLRELREAVERICSPDS
jgi:hypothetical protein